MASVEVTCSADAFNYSLYLLAKNFSYARAGCYTLVIVHGSRIFGFMMGGSMKYVFWLPEPFHDFLYFTWFKSSSLLRMRGT